MGLRYVLPIHPLTVDRTYCEKKAAMIVLARLLEVEEPLIDSSQPSLFGGAFTHHVIQETLLRDFEQVNALYQSTQNLDLALKKVLLANAAHYLKTFRQGTEPITFSLFTSCKRTFLKTLNNFIELCKRVILPTTTELHNLVIDGELFLYHELGLFELQGYVDLLYWRDSKTIAFVEIKSGNRNSNNSKQVKCYEEMAEINNWFPDSKIIAEVWYPYEIAARRVTSTRKNKIPILQDIRVFLMKCLKAESLDIFATPYNEKICNYCNLCGSHFHDKIIDQLMDFRQDYEWKDLNRYFNYHSLNSS